MPNGDILIHAGDFTMFSKSAAATRDVNEWLGELHHRHKILIPGNHVFFLEAESSKRRLVSNATMLINESVEVMDLKIWGSPITVLAGGAIGMSSSADRKQLYSQIPDDKDVLVTHGPPRGILARSPGTNEHTGCSELSNVVTRIEPKLHVFGHIHGGHGTLRTERTLFVNAALLGLDGELSASAIVIRVPLI